MKSLNIPPNYFYLAIIFSILIKFVFPQGNFIKFPYNLFGIIIMMGGLFFISWTYKLFQKYKTPEDFSKSKKVVTEGPYKFSRNPMYIGSILFLIGLSILLGNYITFICPIIFFIVIDKGFILFEEKKMEKELGKQYLNYKKKTRKWI